MCTTEMQRLERCVISDKVWHYTVWVKLDDFFSIYESKTYISMSISCLYVSALLVCQDCEDNFPEILHVIGKIILHSVKEQWL